MQMLKKTTITILLICFVALPAFSIPGASGEAELFQEAESFYYSKNYPLALETYTEFVDLFPVSQLVPDVQYKRALCMFHLKRYDDSFALFVKIEQRLRSTRYLDFISFWKGMIHFQKKEYDSAIKLFDQYLAKQGDANLTGQTFYYKAVCEAEKESFMEAETTVKKFLADFSGSAFHDHGLLLLAFIHFKTGNADGIIGLYDTPDFKKLSPAMSGTFRLYYAAALVLKNRKDEARKIYKDIIAESASESPNAPAFAASAAVAITKLFTLAQAANDITEMERLIRQAEDTFADNPAVLAEFWTNLGIASYSQKKTDLAEFYLNKAWSYRKRVTVDQSVPLYLARIMNDRGNTSHAFLILEEYLADKTDISESVLFQAGHLAASTGNYAKAIQFLELYMNKFPNTKASGEAAYLLAYAYEKTGARDKALALIDSRGIVVATGSVTTGAGDESTDLDGAVLRLYSRLLFEKGDTARALAVLANYATAHPGDIPAQREYIQLLFMQKKYQEMLTALASARKNNPGLAVQDPEADIILTYFEGLARISRKEYAAALPLFSRLTPELTAKYKMDDIAPYALYYRAWTLYRTDKFHEAAELFALVTMRYKTHALYPQALELAGWCYYSAADYPQAEKYFTLFQAAKADPTTVIDSAAAVKNNYLLAKTMLARNKPAEAAILFASIADSSPQSEFADDSLFEYAGILSADGKAEQAASTYQKLHDMYSASPLAGEALYLRAQVYYKSASYGKARDAFRLYRDRFPKGALSDAALYWGGDAALQSSDSGTAVYFWETLIQEYRQSPFRSEAMRKAAEIHLGRKNYGQALALYVQIAEQYPQEAESMKATEQARKIRYLMQGQTGEEADLSARIEQGRQTATHEGRQAMIDLATLYMAQTDQKNLETARTLAARVAEVKTDTLTASRAQFLLGEYFSKKREYVTAGNEFLKAAFTDASNRDFMAQSMYRSAEMFLAAGDKKSVRDIVARLVENFGASPWTTKGKKLLEGLN